MPAEVGKIYELIKTVGLSDLASTVGSGLQDVLSTPALIAWMENASVMCLDLDDPSLCSLGVKMNMEHIAATPPGSSVTVLSELVSVDGRKYTFRVEASDEFEKIGFGTHERIVTNEAKFMQKASAKISVSQ